ncbi:hypothetical protein ABT119_06325 [Streptomyces sp. NPDC001910]|uniref:hypothetical protein n=1 Tax=Streptomyces sp. NPDC001910 TaxID=3154403 RepID=UPI00332A8738
MTAPLPSSRLSPIAGFTNALYLLYIRQVSTEIHRLEALLAAEQIFNGGLGGPMTLATLAQMRLAFAPGLFIQDPVEAADARTSRDDLRIAYAAALHVDLDSIDPTTGRETK